MRTLAIALLALAALQPGGGGRPHVDVIEVSGLIDPIQVDYVGDAVRSAERSGAEALVLQLDSAGGVVADREVSALARRLRNAAVPVAVWVGPSGGEARGAAFELVRAASVRGVAPGTRVGRRRPGASPAAAVRQGLVELQAPTLGDFIVELDGRRVEGRALETAEVVERPGEEPRRRPTVAVRFAKPGLLSRVLHTAASPSIAYLLLAAGLALAVLELYTAGIGVAAATAAGCLVLASYGLAVLPTRPVAVALMVVATFGYAVDLQAGAPRAWTMIAVVALVAGSLGLYGDGLSVSPLALGTGVVGMTVLMVAGMPAMVRARFSTPTIGRESMVGERGEAVAEVDPEGTVEVRGARWRARTNRATPIAAGQAVRVVGIDGILLEVEPEAGGARDHRRP